MAVLTGAGGELRYNGLRIAKCRDFSLEISRDTLETTTVGEWDRTFTEGLRSATGSATLLYDPSDGATRNILNSILGNEDGPQAVGLVLNAASGIQFLVQAIITSISTPVSAGEVIACSINFQVTGPMAGTF